MNSSRSLTLSELRPNWTDRALFVGTTGSGKTTLARRLLAFRKFVVVHDGKGRLDWSSYILTCTLNDVMRVGAKPLEHPRIIYRPSADELQSSEAQERFFRWVFARGYTTLYVDEVYSVVESGAVNPGLHACITRGRELYVETWCAVQRPTWVPLIVVSEAECAFIFKLRMRDDRVRMEQTHGVDEEDISTLSKAKHEFFYVSEDRGTVGPLVLDMNAVRARR